MPIAVFLWTLGLLVFFGLPNYYRQTPGKVPSFYKSVCRRKIILWSFVVVIIQNFFLSAPYGRNWSCKSPSLQTTFKYASANKHPSPLELRPRQSMASRPPSRRLLRPRLGPPPPHLRPPLQIPQLDPPRLRLRPRRPALGPNLVGRVRDGPLPPLGRELRLGGTSLPRSLAVARHFGCAAGARLRNDPPADANPDAYLLHAACGAGPGLCCDDLRARVCAESYWAGTHLAGCYRGCGGCCECLVLGWVVVAAGYLVFPLKSFLSNPPSCIRTRIVFGLDETNFSSVGYLMFFRKEQLTKP